MSADYLPTMTMPEEEPEPSTEDPQADPLVSKADDGEGAVIMQIEDREDSTEEQQEDIIEEDIIEEDIIEEEVLEPVVNPKKKFKNEEVFRTPTIQPVKDPEKPPKKKRQPTQKQLDALARAREKRKIAREEAKKLKEQGVEPPPSKRQQKQEKQVKEVIQKQGEMFTQEQVSKITANAIEQYEVKRKARKVVKQKKKEEEEQQKKVQQTLNRALGRPDPNDLWGAALSGMYGGH